MTTATQTFSLSAIGQIFIRARDLDRAVHFYRDTLGMPFLFQAPPQMAFFQCGATTVMLGVPEAPELDHPAPLVYYLVPDIAPAHAPAPENDAERLVFRQLYETLIRVDCLGRVLPGLAESWTRDVVSRPWTFTLRTDARFWDGAPVSARDVVAAWAGEDLAVSLTLRPRSPGRARGCPPG